MERDEFVPKLRQVVYQWDIFGRIDIIFDWREKNGIPLYAEDSNGCYAWFDDDEHHLKVSRYFGRENNHTRAARAAAARKEADRLKRERAANIMPFIDERPVTLKEAWEGQ